MLPRALDFFLNNCIRQFSMMSMLVQEIGFSPSDSARLEFRLTLYGLAQGRAAIAWVLDPDLPQPGLATFRPTR